MDGDEVTSTADDEVASVDVLEAGPVDRGDDEAGDPPGYGDAEEESIPWWWPTTRYPGDDEARRWLRRFVTFLVVGGCCGYVFWLVRPDLIFLNTTPTGGDMGAHVWGPAYLRDFLLPHGRLAGWAPDWYAGFPAYTFYMVVPSLAIVALDVGFLGGWLGAAVAAVVCGGLAWLVHRRLSGRVVRALAFIACGLAFVLSIDVPYNVAFKLIAVSGLVLLPAAVWYLASGLSLRFPGPELLALASLPFLMDKSLFSILGGNIASTMAGEFSFSISFTAGIFFLGVAARGMATGKHRAWGAVLLSVCALSHIIPAIYMVFAILLLLALRPTKRALTWLIPTGVVAFLISLFWYVPFLGFSTYLNDMGWEKYGALKCGGSTVPHNYLSEYLNYLYPIAPHNTGCPGVPHTPTDDPNMLHGRIFFILAGVGVVLSLLLMVRAGIYFTLLGVVAGLGFWLMPQHRFWNARILPLYYLCVYLMAGIGVWLVIRSLYLLVVGRWAHPPDWLNYPVLAVAVVFVFFLMGVSIRMVPGGYGTDANGVRTTDPAAMVQYHLGPITTTYNGPVRDWVAWNFEGYENKPRMPAPDATKKQAREDRKDWLELRGIRDTMTTVGQEHGCGRTFWEYEPNLNRFGTPMALMLLPYWTHSCIGSMEGLYFEASSTTPFHFIVQSELSKQCSCAQRFDTLGVEPSPYHGVDGEIGVEHLQMLGVKYFMATSDTVKQLAAADSRLKKVASTGPWDVYEVADAPLVEGLDHLPAVWTNVDDGIHEWAKPAVDWFTHPEQWDVEMASSGERSWPRVAYPRSPKAVPVKKAKVSHVKATRDTITFDVDRVGTPVLVKTSYFPDWESADARGPYRVAPNLMVVVPTSKHVVLTYGRSTIEVGSTLLSLLGLGLLVVLIRRPEPEGVVPWEMLGDRDEVPAEPDDHGDADADAEHDADDEGEPAEPAEPGDPGEPSVPAEPPDPEEAPVPVGAEPHAPPPPPPS
jgi:hypothetical protein